MSTETRVRPLTKKKAQQCLKAIEKQFANEFDPKAGAGDRPTLYEPGFHADCWTIAWEGNYEWTYRAFHGGVNDEMWHLAFNTARQDGGCPVEEAREHAHRIAKTPDFPCPDGVFAEPVNGWCLGLYRKEA